jgi:hypothetical protein
LIGNCAPGVDEQTFPSVSIAQWRRGRLLAPAVPYTRWRQRPPPRVSPDEYFLQQPPCCALSGGGLLQCDIDGGSLPVGAYPAAASPRRALVDGSLAVARSASVASPCYRMLAWRQPQAFSATAAVMAQCSPRNLPSLLPLVEYMVWRENVR